MKLLLASESPRRKELLANLGYDFETVKLNCEEIYPEDLECEKVAAYLSELKSASFRELKEDEILLTADTIVVINDEILGKPKNLKGAKNMLQKLSGTVHEVFTAVTLKTQNEMITKTDVAKVYLNNLNSTEIEFYINNFKVLDKAGSYGVQDWLGMAKIKKIEGSFYTIMGFPTHLIYEMLQNKL
ncbi:Maf family nucleotide pyrophosphatase [Halpernia frigidisoli]|uniref:dTTP/UTP pyrophosphatase n=1 Tax=Halpernia frigidisoli TaxID=1125876 RepID=A0A1I3H2J5_9FLAO|nr:Maf family nucleotide pyrophosphatase [Halpernia frigidisoli]SFI29782.1 septum formation protein [Halpernia frigidisoli]